MAAITSEPNSPFQQHNKKILDQLKPGDLLKFKRGIYYHWAVYIGKGKVIHVTGRDGQGMKQSKDGSDITALCSVPQDKADVMEADFWDVAGESKAEVGNMKDEGWLPLDTKTILERARKSLGPVRYHLLADNCEHFAKWCRYDRSESKQADVAVATLSIVVRLLSGVEMTVLLKAQNQKQHS
ncbi:unnamed protein product [Lymnaea stagnalis]|uniref:LRAT domain-containing protein n=1 Tax=Lymnaea stagnalis TaxID=6523 RepID=A0AAV2IQV0_LYMST